MHGSNTSITFNRLNSISLETDLQRRIILIGPKQLSRGKPITIGYVEDHQTTRNILAALLRQQGFILQIEAINGKDFLEQLSQAKTLPEVCLLDLSMPVMNGFVTAKILREKYPSIKILAYSTDDYTEVVEAALKCGAHGFVTKDADPAEIKAGMLAVLNGQAFIRQSENSVRSSGNRKAEYPNSVSSLTEVFGIS